ncbi:LOW QUALITY PROTEIN: membrane-spanning 4-domains subfamily A member 15-like [Lycaon pictus]
MSAAPASNGVFVVIPPSNASGLRPPPAILPTSMCQPPGVLLFEEPLGVQTPRAIQLPDMETFLTGEPKALGIVQILIGLIHLGSGCSVLLLVRQGHAGMLFIEGGVPFWGGACFVISGSPSVAAEKSHTSCLVRSSLGMNILSAMAAFAGTAVLLMDFGVTSWVCCQAPQEREYSEDARATPGGGGGGAAADAGRGSLAVLTVVTTYFGCQATRSSQPGEYRPPHVYPSGASEEGCWLRGLLFQPLASFLGRCLPMDLPTAHSSAGHPPVIFLPNLLSTDFSIPSPAASPPPAYDNVAYMPKESSE